MFSIQERHCPKCKTYKAYTNSGACIQCGTNLPEPKDEISCHCPQCRHKQTFYTQATDILCTSCRKVSRAEDWIVSLRETNEMNTQAASTGVMSCPLCYSRQIIPTAADPYFKCTMCKQLIKKPKVVGKTQFKDTAMNTVAYCECPDCKYVQLVDRKHGSHQCVSCKGIRGMEDWKEKIVISDEFIPTQQIQSDPIGRLDLIDQEVLLRVGKVLQIGMAKYGINNWMRIKKVDHVNHALCHLNSFLRGDTSEDHLVNAICRCVFAASTKTEDDRDVIYAKPQM